MDIILYINSSEREAVTKTLSDATTFTGYLREPSSIIKPSFTLEATNISGYNYCYIAEFNRYYFITDIISVRTGLWKVICSVDVLMSFHDSILNLDVIVSDASIGDQRPTYMNGVPWQTTVKTKTDVINFPSGLLDDGEYILITSGGLVS